MVKVRRFPPQIKSWMLWHRLYDPPIDPIFERAIRTRPSSYPISAVAWGAVLFSLMSCCGLWTLLIPLRSSLAVLLFSLMISASTFYVAAWINQIAGALARERSNPNLFDLLCATPMGTLGVSWDICAAYLHSEDALGWIDAARKVLSGMILFALAVIVATTGLRQNVSSLVAAVQLVVDIVGVVTVSYVDHVQSVVLGCLIAMLVPTTVRGNIDARVLAVFVFLALQVVACLPTVLILIGGNGGDPLFLSLLALCAAREAAIMGLWRVLIVRLNASTAEI